MKGAAVPPLRGKLVAAKPPARSSLLVIGIENESPEITLKLDAPLGGKPEIGSELEFEGVPAAFTKDPFMVTFDVEKAKITGLKMEAPPRPAAKKAGAKKKK
jgi:hypothetical protein